MTAQIPMALFPLVAATWLAAQEPAASTEAASQRHVADELVQQGKPDEALKLLQGLEVRNPGLPGLAARLGKIYYQKRDYERAAEYLSKAIAEDPNDAELVQLLGLSDYLMGHIADAIPPLEKVQTSLPHPDPTGTYILGLCYLQLTDMDKARAALAKAFLVAPESAAAHLVLAKMMMRNDLAEWAVGELQKALQLDPRLPMAHFILGEFYLFKSNAQGSIEEFRKELALDPLAWYAYEGLGDAYIRIENWDEAEHTLKQAIWINPDFSGPYILLGKVELRKGMPDLAAGFLEKALKMDPNNYSAHYMLGTAYKQLGREADAKREIELSENLHRQKLQTP
jgi:tetratricopeptide (TPR) repeat protein